MNESDTLQFRSALPVIAVGIDLAWQNNQRSGIAALAYSPDGTAALIDSPRWLADNDEIVGYFAPFAQHPTIIVGIDAPLAVPNEHGGRLAESQLARAFGTFQAAAYPANRSLLARDGVVRGEVIVDRLMHEHAIRHSPILVPRQPTRQAFEVYPHAAQVVLFGLDRTLKYKRRTDRSDALRMAAFSAYWDGLRKLANAMPPLIIDPALITDNPRDLLKKQHEDRLDAVLCAYIALYYWYWGVERCRIFGDPAGDYAGGYIVAPIDGRIK